MATENISDRIHELPIPLNKHPEEHGGWRIEIDFLETVKGAATEIADRDDWDFGASEEEIEFIILALLYLGKNEEVCERIDA